MKRPTRYGAPDPEQLDTTPIEMPIGYMRPTPLQDLIASMVREAVAVEKGEEFETLEESDDFEEEDPDVLDMSAYTLQDIQEEIPPAPPAKEPEPPSVASEPEPTGDPPDPKAAETG